MTNIFIGEYIKKRRKELGLSQEKLCDGICDPVTLSRIENGRQTPGRSRINALLQRLGMPDDRYYALASKSELEIEALKKQIIACSVLEQPEDGFEKIEELERLVEKDDLLTRQFILRSKILLGQFDGRYPPEKALEMLMEALRLTAPKIDLEEINEGLYTFDEIKIINQIACIYSDTGQRKKALDIYRQTLKYIRKHYQEVLTSNALLQLILYNYARELGLAKCYVESIELAQECIHACVQYGHYQELPGSIAVMAECYYFMSEKEKSADCYLQAYHIYRAIGDKKNENLMKKEAKERLGLVLGD